MKVYVDPPKHMSQAMFRVARALKQYAPLDVRIVLDPKEADYQVLHVIGPDALLYRSEARATVAIQYCFISAGFEAHRDAWIDWWKQQRLVWSYYDLSPYVPWPRMYYAPMGIEPATFKLQRGSRDVGAMTSGYVTGPGAEAIEEVGLAAAKHGMSILHLGPVPETRDKSPMVTPPGWMNLHGVSDHVLAEAYGRSRWVSGLRHVEGFELPALEGLACGARPVLFDRPEMRAWFKGHGV